MVERTSTQIEAAIEAALSGERLLPTPITLHRRVVQRLRIAAMRELEQSRFRYSMAGLAVAALAVLIATAVAVSVNNFSLLISHGVDGGKGQYDYYATAMELSWAGYSGAYSLLSSLLIALGTVCLGLIPLRRYMNSQ